MSQQHPQTNSQPTDTHPSNCCGSFPQAITRASRYELTDIAMNIDGILPDDLQGHVFIIAPVGSIDSGGLPYPGGNSFLNGDGMVYRFDFNHSGEVRVKTRLIKTPDYYADKATIANPEYAKYKFDNYGLVRFSWQLGLRNQLNTAFLPMKFPQESEERLLVTYDAGRPYEIDPDTLEVVTPVGANQEWEGELDQLKFPIPAFKFPFKSILSSAHPTFDTYTGQMFTVNYGRSFANILETINWLYNLKEFSQEIEEILLAITRFLLGTEITNLTKTLFLSSRRIFQELIKTTERIIGIQLQDFTYLVCWDGTGNLQRWKLVLSNGKPVRIEQTVHQIGVTKDYVVLMDTAFIVGIEQVLNNPCHHNKDLEELIRTILERPAVPDSKVYIVRRADLKNGQIPACNQSEVEVVARQVIIPLEAAHFLVDYDNPQGNITIHVAHICGMQVAEWLKNYDVSAYEPHQPMPSYLYGMENDEMDIGRMGRYIIHGDTGEWVSSQVIADAKCTWGVDLYAYLDRLPTGLPPQQLDYIYWSSFGLWKDLLTRYIFNLYKNYKYRLLPTSEILRLADKGISPCLSRINTKSMVIEEYYQFPPAHMILSPQFVPRGDGESQIDGYITCAVCFADKNEIWIFDANKLAKGPLCKLHHPSLQFGFTLHTTWLQKIAKRQSSYNIPVRQDFRELVNANSQEIQQLFEQEVYPHFE